MFSKRQLFSYHTPLTYFQIRNLFCYIVVAIFSLIINKILKKAIPENIFFNDFSDFFSEVQSIPLQSAAVSRDKSYGEHPDSPCGAEDMRQDSPTENRPHALRMR